MRHNILWTGLDYHSTENCILHSTPAGNSITSTVTGCYESFIYKVEYSIKTNAQWHTIYFSINIQLAYKITTLSYESDGNGNWSTNGNPAPEFSGCMDIDISVTPFTNTLAINRLKLKENQQQRITVFYIDILEEKIEPRQQQYTHLSPTIYKFENVPNDFEAKITVDELGLVVQYPGLFERTAIQESNIRHR